MLKDYPYFKESNINEIAQLLNALGTGISNIRIVEVPRDVVTSKIPEEMYHAIIADLEQMNARRKKESIDVTPSIMARATKEFYTFEIDSTDKIIIKTIEFEHECTLI
jgi:hypothetical protein